MRTATLVCAALAMWIFVILMLVADADARGRAGSFRVGGYNNTARAAVT